MTAPAPPDDRGQRVTPETFDLICRRAELDEAEGTATRMQMIALDARAAIADLHGKLRTAEASLQQDAATCRDLETTLAERDTVIATQAKEIEHLRAAKRRS